MTKRIIALLISVLFIVGMLCFAACKPNEPEKPEKTEWLPSWGSAAADTTNDNYRVFYQIFVGSFSDSNGDGIGDLRGIINRMDYLNDGDVNSGKSLGVQGLWLSPIFQSPSYHKYDAADYYKVDSKFGTEADLKELISLCHERNVKVILDLAINHTSNINQWFVKFRQARKNNQIDDPYYNFYTCVSDSERENNHTYYNVPGCSNVYYEGNFSSEMPELNYDMDAVRTEMVNVAKYYLDMGIDGFRFDAIKYIYFNDTARNVEFWQWYMQQLREIKSDIYTVGECWESDSEMLNYYPAMNCFSFDTAQSKGKIADAVRNGTIYNYASYVVNFQDRMAEKNPNGMYCPFIANHDMDRAAGYLTVDSGDAYMAANLLLLCSGSPFIYYGEEIGMKGTKSGDTDANRRLAMLWGDNDTIKNPIGSNYKAANQINGTVLAQIADVNSLLLHYAKVIHLRTKYPEIARGAYTLLDCDASSVGAFSITYGNSTIGLFHNVSDKEVTITLPQGVSFSNVADFVGKGNATISGNKLTIGPQTSVIVK